MNISKTTFQDYLFCPRNIWLKLHKPELLHEFALSNFEKHLVEQGNEVELCAHNLFPNAVEVAERDERGVKKTTELIAAKTPTIFQATFIIDGFIARNDALSWDSHSNSWSLYEVKGTNDINEKENDHNHLDDLAFQAVVLRRAGIPVDKYYLVHLNREYVRSGELDYQEMLVAEDKTADILLRLEEIEIKMETAKSYLQNEKEPRLDDCKCIYRGRSGHCTTFKYSYPDVPEYSVHDIARIGSSKKKLEALIERGIYNIENIPEDVTFSEIQNNQIDAHRSGKTHVKIDKLREELDALSYPLYFFDYETYAPAVPQFDTYRPYQRIPFQFSLHILERPDGDLIHKEYLHTEMSDPTPEVAKRLEEWIGAKGTVIAWHKSFEAGVNKEIGERLPKYRAVMEHINNMLYDLEDVFKKQHYVHPNFHGSSSIKKVQPTLVPDLSYKDLEIHEGGQASSSWWTMVSPDTTPEESGEIAKNLLEYCGRDTYAMYVVWKELRKLL
ncbi:MAG: DUF2779 domain-containing protein [Candidatus Paceibacterota bacterium]